MTYFERIEKIAKACRDANVPYTMVEWMGGYVIRFHEWCRGDAACHDGTYGRTYDCVESYRFPWDCGDVTVLTVQEAIDAIINHYHEVKGN